MNEIFLTDESWAAVAPLLPKTRIKKDAVKIPWRDPRDVLDGILWWLLTEEDEWFEMPNPYGIVGPVERRYAPYGVCCARYKRWKVDGTFEAILRVLDKDLRTAVKRSNRYRTDAR